MSPLRLTVVITKDNARLRVELTVHNRSPRPHYAIAKVRSVDYEPATRLLTLRFLEQDNLPAGVSTAAFVRPPFAVLQPGADTVIRTSLPDVLRRHAAAPGTDGRRPIELLPIGEADEVRVALATSDVPFYVDPREPGDHTPVDYAAQLARPPEVAAQRRSLAAWNTTTLTGVWRRSAP